MPLCTHIGTPVVMTHIPLPDSYMPSQGYYGDGIWGKLPGTVGEWGSCSRPHLLRMSVTSSFLLCIVTRAALRRRV